MSADSSSQHDVVIVGGGVIGLGIAWRAAQRGLAVTVVDPAPGSGASHVAAGMLTPVTEVQYGEEAQLRLTLRAAAAYPRFVAELEDATGQQVAYRACGMIAVAFDRDDLAALNDLRDFQLSLGLEVESLTGRDCRKVEPMLAPSVQGGLLAAGDHQVDPRRLTEALLAATEREGVRIRRQAVKRLRRTDGSVTGVELDDQTAVSSETVVMAAGCRSGQLDGLPVDLHLPVRPVKGQVVRLRSSPSSALSRSVRAMVRGSSVYVVPRTDGEVVIGATQEERGFDEEITAGAVYDLLRDASAIVPGISEMQFVEVNAGLRPTTPDNAPVVGAMPIDGLVAATGHHRNGILLTPVTADAVADLLVEGTMPEFLTPFSPQRFLGQVVAR